MSGKSGSAKRQLTLRTDEERAAIMPESFAPGATVVGVARKHGFQPNLLSSWRSASRRAKEPRAFSTVEVAPDIVPPACSEAIEIMAGSVVIRLSVATLPKQVVEIAPGLARS